MQRTSHSGFQQGTLADFTTLYDGYGAQLGQISPLSEAQYPTPDLVGYGGEWGCVTDNETAPIGGGAQKSAVREPLVWMGHREYDPSVGRFVTRDPVGYEGGINVYAYTHNNPILHADPTGLDDEDYGGSILGQLFNPATWKRAIKKELHFVNRVTTAPFRWTWRKIKAFTSPKMDPSTPTLMHPYLDPDTPETYEVNGRYQQAGRAIPNYLDDVAVQVLQAGVLTYLTPGSLSVEEESAVADALDNLDAETIPSYGKKWGTSHMNREGRLPGAPGAGGYKEYYVRPAPGVSGSGARRLVVGSDGSIYYTSNHYQSFVRIR